MIDGGAAGQTSFWRRMRRSRNVTGKQNRLAHLPLAKKSGYWCISLSELRFCVRMVCRTWDGEANEHLSLGDVDRGEAERRQQVGEPQSRRRWLQMLTGE